MMVFTHVLVGGVIGILSATVFVLPLGGSIVAAALGGLLPDVDMVLTHRRSFHFPVLASVAGVLTLSLGVATSWQAASLLGLVLISAGVHALMDTLGGGKEMRPWREVDDRAVYNHVSGEWIPPYRLFYDGSLPDFLISVFCGSLLFVVAPGAVGYLALIVTAVGGVYTLLRRRITRLIPEQHVTFSSYINSYIKKSFEGFK